MDGVFDANSVDANVGVRVDTCAEGPVSDSVSDNPWLVRPWTPRNVCVALRHVLVLRNGSMRRLEPVVWGDRREVVVS
jgi:hypothetical protein